MSNRLWIRGGRLVDPSQDLDGFFDLLLEDGKVVALGDNLSPQEPYEVLAAEGLVVVPGLVDMHVHFREPGQEYKETIRTGSQAAAAGGFTAVACMANTVPVNDCRSVTEHIVAEASRHGLTRVYPVGAVSQGFEGKALAEMGEMVAAGAVAFSDDGLPVTNSELMRRALLYSQHYSVPVIQHAEDLDLAADGVMHEGEWSTRLGLPGIPGASEDAMVARDLLLLEETGGQYHVAHVSTARTIDLIRGAREKGLPVTCEVTPHHLLLTDKAVADSEISPDTKMKPPLRAERDRLALLEALVDGTVDVIASDHAPHHPDEKSESFHMAPFGVVGLETTLSLCLDRLVRPGTLKLSRLVELLSTKPAEILGLPGGNLKEGAPGDVTLLHLDREVVVARDSFQSRSKNTPFEGWKLRGAPMATVLGGRVVYQAQTA